MALYLTNLITPSHYHLGSAMNKFVIFLILLISSCSYDNVKTIHLISIAGSYENNTSLRLKSPYNDGLSISAAFIEQAKYNNINLDLKLLNKNNLLATKNNIINSIRDLKIKKNDIIVLFFSGHAIKESLVCESSLFSNSQIVLNENNLLSKDELYSLLRNLNSKVLVILDCCYSGSFIKEKKYYINKNIFFLTSSSKDELSFEPISIDEFSLSYFSKELSIALGAKDTTEPLLFKNGKTSFYFPLKFNKKSNLFTSHLEREVIKDLRIQNPDKSYSLMDLKLF